MSDHSPVSCTFILKPPVLWSIRKTLDIENNLIPVIKIKDVEILFEK